jgi:hypothetical protein
VYSNLTFFARFPGASEYHDGQVNVLSCLPDWQVALSKKWPSLMFSMSDKFFNLDLRHLSFCNNKLESHVFSFLGRSDLWSRKHTNVVNFILTQKRIPSLP